MEKFNANKFSKYRKWTDSLGGKNTPKKVENLENNSL